MAPTRFKWQFPVRRPYTTIITTIIVTAALFLVGMTFSRHSSLSDLVRPDYPALRRWMDLQSSLGNERSVLLEPPGISPGEREKFLEYRDFVQERLGEKSVAIEIPAKSRERGKTGDKTGLVFVSIDHKSVSDHEIRRRIKKMNREWLSLNENNKAEEEESGKDDEQETMVSETHESRMEGELALRHEVHSVISRWLGIAPLTLPLLALFVFLGGGGLKAVVSVMLVFGTSLGAVIATSRALGGNIDLDIAFPGVVSLFLSVFFVRRLLDSVAAARPGTKSKRVGSALFAVVGPILLSAGLIAICLAGMGGSRFSGVRRPALIAAVGVLTAAAASTTIVPGILSLWPGKWNETPSRLSKLSRWTRSAGKPLVRRPVPWLLAVFLLFLGGSVWSLRSPISHELFFSSSDIKTLFGRTEKTRPVSISLVIQAPDKNTLTSHETLQSMDLLSRKLSTHPKILGVTGFQDIIVNQTGHEGVAGETPEDTRRLNKLLAPYEPTGRLILAVECKSTGELGEIARWIETTAMKSLPDKISSHTTGALVSAGNAADELTKAYLVGLVRFVGMLLLLMIAISKDPRLGLTAITPPAATLVILGSLIAAISASVQLIMAYALILTAVWCSTDALDALLRTAQLRITPPGMTPAVTAPSLRSSLLLAPFVPVAGFCCMSPFFAPAGVLAALGIGIGSLLSAFLVPMMLNYMPEARLHGPLWEHKRKKKKR